MPELPEVQTVVNGIKSKINKHKILRFKKYISKLRYPIQKNLSSKVESSTVTTVFRRAKYIIINLSNNRSLVIHLGMSGRIIIEKDNKKKMEKLINGTLADFLKAQGVAFKAHRS